MTINDALRLRIFELCEERHMTINGLCSVCGLNQSTISNIIYGRNNSTNVSTIQKICRHFSRRICSGIWNKTYSEKPARAAY